MKPRFIVLIIAIGIAIATIVSLYGSVSEYVTFGYAKQNIGKEYHVIGKLMKDSSIYYDAVKDANYLEFYMADTLNQVEKVVFNNPMPPDLERSEQVVIVGKMTEKGHFQATSILLKCPSKYNDGKLEETKYEVQ